MHAEIQNRHPTGLFRCALTACILNFLAPARAEDLPKPADFPEAYYHHAQTLGKKILRVDSAQSLVVIEVRRAGALALMGHDHVVASHDVGGYASPTDGLADLSVPLERLAVDEPGLRAQAGFSTQPSPQDIEGTRRNMLEKTLDAAHFPYALIHVIRSNDNPHALNISITLRGMTHSYQVPAQIETVSGGIAIDGKMAFKQTDFGITPLTVFGGALRVQDGLSLRFHIVAKSD